MVKAAATFLASLDDAAKTKAVYSFESDERYNFHFFPKDDRRGISLNELSPAQRQAAMGLLKSTLSETGQKKALAVIQLEGILKEVEGRKAEDRYRDSGKYYFTLFGTPGNANIWGWRLEGHHLSFTFSANKNELVSGTPAFLGANPAVVRSGPHAGKQILKEEADAAFNLVQSLSEGQLKKAVINTTAPNEIVTFIDRDITLKPAGIRYRDLTAAQQKQLLQLVGIYINRYTKLFRTAMLKEVETAGLENLYFAWAGATTPAIGQAHYYRIQGPTIIIEYDNSQNDANHVHSVLRDLKHDFGGDVLLQHYKAAH